MTGLVRQFPGLTVSMATLVGFWQAGSNHRRGWAIAAVAELFWLPYAAWIGQWGLEVANVVFLAIYVTNWARWKPPAPEPETALPTTVPGSPSRCRRRGGSTCRF